MQYQFEENDNVVLSDYDELEDQRYPEPQAIQSYFHGLKDRKTLNLFMNEERKNGDVDGSQADRAVNSDEEGTKDSQKIIYRRMDMLNIDDIDQEFEVKTNCKRKKSQDFTMEKQKLQIKLVKQELSGGNYNGELKNLVEEKDMSDDFLDGLKRERRYATHFAKRASKSISQ